MLLCMTQPRLRSNTTTTGSTFSIFCFNQFCIHSLPKIPSIFIMLFENSIKKDRDLAPTGTLWTNRCSALCPQCQIFRRILCHGPNRHQKSHSSPRRTFDLLKSYDNNYWRTNLTNSPSQCIFLYVVQSNIRLFEKLTLIRSSNRCTASTSWRIQPQWVYALVEQSHYQEVFCREIIFGHQIYPY